MPLWILGSSLFGAQVAAALGLPFAFASHFAPSSMMDAIAIYRSRFQPSAQLQQPYVMLGFNVFAADTDEEAQLLATSMQQAFVNLRTGMPTELPPPVGAEPRPTMSNCWSRTSPTTAQILVVPMSKPTMRS